MDNLDQSVYDSHRRMNLYHKILNMVANEYYEGNHHGMMPIELLGTSDSPFTKQEGMKCRLHANDHEPSIALGFFWLIEKLNDADRCLLQDDVTSFTIEYGFSINGFFDWQASGRPMKEWKS